MMVDAPAFATVAAEIDHPPLPLFDPPPFVQRIASNRQDAAAFDWWNVVPTGDAAADFARSVQFSGLAVVLARKLGRPDVLGLVVTAIV